MCLPAGCNQPPPSVLLSVWDAPHLRKIVFEDGKCGIECLWCFVKFRTGKAPNATKGLCHLAKIHGHGIAVCAGPITHSWSQVYADLWNRKQDRKGDKAKRQQEFRVNDFNMHQMTAASFAQKKRLPASKPLPVWSLKSSFATPSPRDSNASASIVTNSGFFDNPAYDSVYAADFGCMNDGSSPLPHQDLEFQVAFSRMIYCLGLSFGFGDHQLVKDTFDAYKRASRNVPLPNRKSVSGENLNLCHGTLVSHTLDQLRTDAELGKISIISDGATIKKKPLTGILAAGLHTKPTLLEIADATHHLCKGNKKDASYIRDKIVPWIERLGPRNVAQVCVDGASDVQAAGRLLQVPYPWIDVNWGAEHVVGCWFSDVSKVPHVRKLFKMSQVTHKWFGGSHHGLHCLMQKATAQANNVSGQPLGMLKVAGTRLAGHHPANLRECRIKKPLKNCANSDIAASLKVPEDLIKLLEDDDYWEAKLVLAEIMEGPWRVLRLADGENFRGQDKMQFYSTSCLKKLQRLVARANSVFIGNDHPDWDDSVWAKMDEFLGSKAADLDPESDPTSKLPSAAKQPTGGLKTTGLFDSSLFNESSEDGNDDGDDDPSFSVLSKSDGRQFPDALEELDGDVGRNLVRLWARRMPALLTDLARVARLCSPSPEVMKDVNNLKNVSVEDWEACRRILEKHHVRQMPTKSEQDQENNTVWSTFKMELAAFHGKRGVFGKQASSTTRWWSTVPTCGTSPIAMESLLFSESLQFMFALPSPGRDPTSVLLVIASN